jgi:hypothetical protein
MRVRMIGSDTVQGRAQQIAKQIGDQLKQRFQQQGWISGS